MDPITQVLTQQQSGSASGAGFGQFFQAGQQARAQRDQINLARKQEQRLSQRQSQLLPYEQSLMAAQIVAAGQTAEFNRQKLLTTVQQNNSLPEILALESYFMQSPNGYKDPQGRAIYEQLYSRYPQAFAEGAPGHSLRMQIQAPTIFDAEMKRLDEANARLKGSGLYAQRFDDNGRPVLGELNTLDNNWQPTPGTITHPITGESIPFMKTSPRSAQPMLEPELQELTDPVTGERRTVLRSGMSGAKTLPESIGKRQVEQFTRQQQAKDADFVRSNNPQGYAAARAQGTTNGLPAIPNETFSNAASAASVESGTKARIEQELMGSESLIQTGRDLFPLLTTSNVGIPGFFNRWSGRLGLDALIPGNATAAEQAATLGRVFMSSIFRTLRSDSNINANEVRSLEEASPDPAQFFTQPEAVKGKMSVLLRSAAAKSRANAQRLGRPITPFFLTRDEIRAQLEAGLLTREQAIDAYNNKSVWTLIDALEAKPEAESR